MNIINQPYHRDNISHQANTIVPKGAIKRLFIGIMLLQSGEGALLRNLRPDLKEPPKESSKVADIEPASEVTPPSSVDLYYNMTVSDLFPNALEEFHEIATGPFIEENITQREDLSRLIYGLGYGTNNNYFTMLQQNKENNSTYRSDINSNEITLSKESITQEHDRFQSALNAPLMIPLLKSLGPNPFEPSSSSAVMRLELFLPTVLNNFQDTVISVDGPNAGRTANAFIKLYQQSNMAFKMSILALTQQQGGKYSIHNAPLSSSGGYNTVGIDFNGLSGIYIDENIKKESSLMRILTHEISHDLHLNDDNTGLLAGQTKNTGDIHSMEQTAFIMGVISALVDNQVIEPQHIDQLDYSNDLMFIDDYRPSWDKVVDGHYSSVEDHAYRTMQSQIKEIFNKTNSGDIEGAAEIILNIPAQASITLNSVDPQFNSTKSPVCYNVRDLICRNLLVGYNVHRFYGEDHSGWDQFQDHLPNVIETINRADPTFMRSLEHSANAIYLPIRHLPFPGNQNPLHMRTDQVRPDSDYDHYGKSCLIDIDDMPHFSELLDETKSDDQMRASNTKRDIANIAIGYLLGVSTTAGLLALKNRASS